MRDLHFDLSRDFPVDLCDQSALPFLLSSLSQERFSQDQLGCMREKDLVDFLKEKVGEKRMRNSPLSPSLFHIACDLNYLSLCHLLCEWKINVNIPNGRGQAPLHRAVANERREFCKEILLSDADVNQQDSDGWSPLHFASSVEMCVLLLSCGAMVDMTDNFGMSCLHKSAATNSLLRCSLLLKVSANVNLQTQNGTTPLHCAARSDTNGKLCELLLDHDADVDAQDIDGWTPLHVAADSENWAVCSLLLSRGADPRLLNRNCESAMDIAHSRGNYQIFGSEFSLK